MRRLLALTLLAALTLPAQGAHALLPQNDAGSGGDAPNVPTASFRIQPDTVYGGTVEGRTGGDSDDWYAFSAPAGAALEGRVASPVGCLGIHDATGAELAVTCSLGFADLGPVHAVATTAGTYYLRYNHNQPTTNDTVPHAYQFALGVNGPAPSPVGVNGSALVLFGDGTLPPVAPATESGDHVVVAVVDTGVNLYHDFFRAPALTDHPSTWLPGFPASAEPVALSLAAPDQATAEAADAATFAGLRRSAYNPATDAYDTHLYTFPGTRVVAGVSFGEYADPVSPPTRAWPVADDDGHGTHSAGLALGADLDAADGNVLLVAVEIGQGTFEDGIRWAARQPWIDAISVSLGSRANAPGTDALTGTRRGADWATHEAFQAGKPVFMASGNGFSNSGVTPDHCSTYTSEYTGPAWITRIGAGKRDSGNPTWWHCVPVEAIARTDVDAPSFDDLHRAGAAGGTSAATPNAAGHFAHLLLAGRRAGSTATRLDTLAYLLHAATPPPVAAGANDPSAYPLSLADQGYGLVDQAALDAAVSRLVAAAGPAPRPETEAWFANDAAIRTALWGPGSATDRQPLPSVQDDAGSGGDAPGGPSDQVVVQPGVRYDGLLTGVADDDTDWYAFIGTAGDVVSFDVSGAAICYDMVSPAGAVLASNCGGGYAVGGPITGTLDQSGTWYLTVRYFSPQPYRFGFALNAPAPVLLP